MHVSRIAVKTNMREALCLVGIARMHVKTHMREAFAFRKHRVLPVSPFKKYQKRIGFLFLPICATSAKPLSRIGLS